MMLKPVRAAMRRGRKGGKTAAKKAVAVAVAAALAAGIAAGAIFMHRDSVQRRMSQQVVAMESERQQAALAAAVHEQKTKKQKLSAAEIARLVLGAFSSVIGAFLARLLCGALSAAGKPLAAAAVGGIVPALFVMFTLYYILFRLFFKDVPASKVFTIKAAAVLAGASVIMGAVNAVCASLIENQLAAGTVQSLFTVAAFAAVWVYMFMNKLRLRELPLWRSIAVLACALGAGLLRGAAELWLISNGHSAGAAAALLYAVWLVGMGAAAAAAVVKKHKAGKTVCIA